MHASKGRKRVFSRKSQSVGGAMLRGRGFCFLEKGGGDARTKEGGDERNKARDTKQTKQQLYGYRRILFGKFAPGGATLPKKIHCHWRHPLGQQDCFAFFLQT